MYFFEVLRRPEILLASQGYPQNPVVDVGIEPRRLAVNRVPPLFGEGKRYAAVVGEAVFGLQVGIAARLEVKVIERGETVVARNGCLGPDVSGFREQVIGIECRNERRPILAVHILSQRQREAQPFGRRPLGSHISR